MKCIITSVCDLMMLLSRPQSSVLCVFYLIELCSSAAHPPVTNPPPLSCHPALPPLPLTDRRLAERGQMLIKHCASTYRFVLQSDELIIGNITTAFMPPVDQDDNVQPSKNYILSEIDNRFYKVLHVQGKSSCGDCRLTVIPI